MIYWLAGTAVFWVYVLYGHYKDEINCRGYRDVEAERQDIEDAACAWVLMWALTGWVPCGVWVVLS